LLKPVSSLAKLVADIVADGKQGGTTHSRQEDG